MDRMDILYILNYVYELEALYEADDVGVIPQYIYEQGLNVKQILEQEQLNDLVQEQEEDLEAHRV